MSSPPQDRTRQTSIDICVCTFRRPQIEQTLRSIGALSVPEGVTVRIIVADNDLQPSARKLVGDIAAELPFEILYVHCPASNISLARNACIESSIGDFLAFIDDDETASKNWLTELLKTAETTGADAVLGPVHAVCSGDVPRWMSQGDFHSTAPVWVKGEIRTGYTCNVLLRRAAPSIAGRRFNLVLGRTGGEDTEYFTQMFDAGGSIAYAPRAVVHEVVPDTRARFSWLAKRRFRSGQTHGRLLCKKRSAAGRFPQLGLAAAKAFYCFGAAAAAAALPRHRNRFALRGVLHTGVVVGLLGVREIHQYGDSAQVRRHGNAA